MKYIIKTNTFLADTITPVLAYLRLRYKFPYSVLLEGSDYSDVRESRSFIALDRRGSIALKGSELHVQLPREGKQVRAIDNRAELLGELQEFMNSFQTDSHDNGLFGLFGFMDYDLVKYFHDLPLERNQGTSLEKESSLDYGFYRHVLMFNHFKNELSLISFYPEGESDDEAEEEIIRLVKQGNAAQFSAALTGAEKSDQSDKDFMKKVSKAKQHCRRGDVFQIVLSRKFTIPYQGDDFEIYRQLRSVNPSPYLFYFDLGQFRLFGSSPEVQLLIEDGNASIHPIAGTFKRTGDKDKDKELANLLKSDKKENAEHTMLVDLARNDLSRFCDKVKVENFREIQYYSHVVHMVSKVTGQLKDKTHVLPLVADTFPAGTLSGAPKHRAMELISEIENSPRGYYGGCIGFMGFNGSFNHAIMIRTFLSTGNELTIRAGAGVVVHSDEQSECNEVNNKLAALRKSLEVIKTVN